MLPVDPDVDLSVPQQRQELRWAVLVAISAGGIVGALGRYGLGVALPNRPAGFPWATFAINASGCFLIGVLMVLVTQVWTRSPLLRPFLGVGVLGGYTTFSAYVVDIQHLVDADAAPTALLYLAGTLLVALAAVWAGSGLTRWVLSPRWEAAP
jgi:CrcB protein